MKTKVKFSYTCPNCGTKKIVSCNIWLYILLCLTIIGIIIWSLVTTRCPKCGVTMEHTKTVQCQKFTDATIEQDNQPKVE